MKILSLDTASSSCNVCVWENGNVLAIKTEKMSRGQDARLIPLIEEVMETASVSYDDIDLISVVRGAGSFTGIRIGLSCARGIGLASEKAVIGIDRFSIYRDLFKNISKPLFVILDSRRSELFVKVFVNNDNVFDPEDAFVLSPDKIVELSKKYNDFVIVGDAHEILMEYFDDKYFCKTNEEEVVSCARISSEIKNGDKNFLPTPLYLRAPDVCKPKKCCS